MRVHDCRFVVLFQGVVHVYHYVIYLVEDSVNVVRGAASRILLRRVDLGRVREVTLTLSIVHVF